MLASNSTTPSESLGTTPSLTQNVPKHGKSSVDVSGTHVKVLFFPTLFGSVAAQ